MISSVNYLLFIAWGSEGTLVYLLREPSLKNKRSILGEGVAFSLATDQMKISLSPQCLLWPITISSSYYSSYTLFHSSTIRAAFLIGLAYPSCLQLWHGAVDVVDGLPLCVSWPSIPSPSCLNFARLSFCPASSEPEEQLTFDLCFINTYNLWAGPYVLNIFGDQAKEKRILI